MHCMLVHTAASTTRGKRKAEDDATRGKRQPLPVPSNVHKSSQMIAFAKHTFVKREGIRRGKRELLHAAQVWRSNASFCTKMSKYYAASKAPSQRQPNQTREVAAIKYCTSKVSQLPPGIKQSFPHAIVALWST